MPLDPEKIAAMKQTLKDGGIQVAAVPDLFPTPWKIVEQMIQWACIPRDNSRPLRILEPSAGLGDILKRLRDCDDKVAVELNPEVFLQLAYRCVRSGTHYYEGDFLNMTPAELGGPFDRILMNPPFSKHQDIAHILHARTFLKRAGCLVGICANGPRQEERLKPIADVWEELPEGTFKDQGTNVRAVMLRITGRRS